MIATLKLVHIAAVSIWMAGLVSLPGLFFKREQVAENEEMFRLQRMVRHAYLVLVSPAAFIAIATGTGLIFLREAFEPWLSVKLALVGALVVIHTISGLVIIRLFREGEMYPVWRFIGMTITSLTLVLCVLYLVLAKPVLSMSPSVLSEPGGLGRLFDGFNPWRKP